MFGRNHPLVAWTWNLVGNEQFREQKYNDALKSYKSSVACDVGCHLADSYANIGTVYWTLGKVDDAIDFLHRAQRVAEYHAYKAKKDPSKSLQIASIRYQKGLAYTLKGSFHKAIRQLNICRQIREACFGSCHVDIARVEDAIGKAYTMLGDLESAQFHHHLALNIKKELIRLHAEDSSCLESTLTSLGQIHRLRGDIDASIQAFQVVLQSQKRRLYNRGSNGLRKSIAHTLKTLGNAYETRRNDDLALACYREGFLFCKAADLPGNDSLLKFMKLKIVKP